jgi:AcrR family transcriptional regulator
VSPTAPVARSSLGRVPYRAAQMRILTASLALFGEHGVSGTSLQMIAEAIGVTKAAVYHQFKTKEAIVVAAVELELVGLEAALDAAASGHRDQGALETLLAEVIDLAVARRRMVNSLLHDPVIVRLLAEHEPFQQFMARLYHALLGADGGATARLRVAMITSAIGGAVTHPLVADLDDATLRTELLRFTRRFLDIDH